MAATYSKHEMQCLGWVSVIGGLHGELDWSTGLEHWTGVLEYWSTVVLECTINWL